MSYSYTDTPTCCPTASAELKLYQAFIFSIPIFFTFILVFLFYLFYIRRRRVDWSALQMRVAYQNNPRILESGLKKEFREMLPIIVFNESFSIRDTLCSVCLGEYQNEDRLQQIPVCSHTFHMECIDHWLATNTTCPLCRLSLIPPTKSDLDLSSNQQETQPVETQSEVISQVGNAEDNHFTGTTESMRVDQHVSSHVSNEEVCDLQNAAEQLRRSADSVVPDIEGHTSGEKVDTGVGS